MAPSNRTRRPDRSAHAGRPRARNAPRGRATVDDGGMHAAVATTAGSPTVARVEPFEWHTALCHEDTPTGPGCQPAVLQRLVYADQAAAAVGDFTSYSGSEFLAACHGCEWRGHPVQDENEATEAAHDHVFPGWRSLPVLPRLRGEPTHQQSRDLRALVERLYPSDWVRRHGPVLTRRSPNATRHVPNRALTGGYDMSGAVEEDLRPAATATQQTLF